MYTKRALTIEESIQLAAEMMDCGKDSAKKGPKKIYANGAKVAQWHCSRCHETGHNSQTGSQDVEITKISE